MFGSNGNRSGWPEALAGALAEVVQGVLRSLVVVQIEGRRPGVDHGVDARTSVGAGVIWERSGLVVTNRHVAAAGSPRLLLADGSVVHAQVVHQDPEVDLALLRADTGDLPAAPVGDSRSLRVGELVLAAGHPWGQRGVVTAGLFSGRIAAQTQKGGRKLSLLRSDVQLAPGNSGGPLVNARGEVIGINTLIVGGDQSVAIPSEEVRGFVDRALARERAGAAVV